MIELLFIAAQQSLLNLDGRPNIFVIVNEHRLKVLLIVLVKHCCYFQAKLMIIKWDANLSLDTFESPYSFKG
jgi:hypothetical protein